MLQNRQRNDISANSLANEKPPVTTPNARIDFIDGLRGVAILLVVAYHAWTFSNAPLAYWWNPLHSGYLGVDLFLILSGFCLYWPMVRPGSKSSSITLASFAKRRIRRIVPPYYGALIVFTVMALIVPGYPDIAQGSSPHHIFESFALHLVFLQNLIPQHKFEIAGPFWSLALEVQLYVGMPILVAIASRFGVGRAAIFAAVVTVLFRSLTLYYVAGSPLALISTEQNADLALILDFFLGRWIEFGCGMWAAAIVASGSNKIGVPALFSCAALCLMMAQLMIRNPALTTCWQIVPACIGFICLILLASAQQHTRSGLYTFLSRKWLTRLGAISYSVYLIHQPLLRLGIKIVETRIHSHTLIFLISNCVLLPLIVGIASVFYRYLEKPFLSAPAASR